MSVPVYQIMGKGCHRQDENMSFSPLFVKNLFVDLLDRSQIVMWITLCINYLHRFLIYYHAFYSMMFVFVFHEVKK